MEQRESCLFFYGRHQRRRISLWPVDHGQGQIDWNHDGRGKRDRLAVRAQRRLRHGLPADPVRRPLRALQLCRTLRWRTPRGRPASGQCRQLLRHDDRGWRLQWPRRGDRFQDRAKRNRNRALRFPGHNGRELAPRKLGVRQERQSVWHHLLRRQYGGLWRQRLRHCVRSQPERDGNCAVPISGRQ